MFGNWKLEIGFITSDMKKCLKQHRININQKRKKINKYSTILKLRMFIKQLHKKSEKQARSGKRYLQYVNSKEFIYMIYIYITTNHFLENKNDRQPQRKWAKDLNRHFPREEVYMINKLQKDT